MAKIRVGVLAAAVTSTGLLMAVPAHADNGTDFLTLVSGEGLNVGDTPADVQLTLATGEEICGLLHEGYTPEVAVRQVHYVFPTATSQQAGGFLNAAQATLCTQQFAPLTPGGY